ncbi:MAG: DUF6466 family protein [Bifidobacteriaceae bacterium]|nr:DUF6466 family protein [Bifidobacteriaceae bacterium]
MVKSISKSHLNNINVPKPKAKASVNVRIIISLVALLALLATGVSVINYNAASQYNQATNNLERNIAAVNKENADYKTLYTQNELIIQQLESAQAAHVILLPELNQDISHNIDMAKLLSQRLKKLLDANNSDTSEESGNANSGNSNNSSENNNALDGLTQEQREQVEQLLKANQSSNSNNIDNSNADSTKKNPTAKPW